MAAISFSNIAWPQEKDSWVAEQLCRWGVEYIDVAPARYFSDITKISDEQINSVKQYWLDRGIRIVGLQSLLYGTHGFNLFDDNTQNMLDYLRRVAHLGATLGATNLVFGSPKQRDRGMLNDLEVWTRAINFFNALGNIGREEGVVFCLEPNGRRYGCNFMLKTEDCLSVIKSVNHPAIRLQLDTGNILDSGGNPISVLRQVAPWVGHVHLSEPDLGVPGSIGSDIQPFLLALNDFEDISFATIEMLSIHDGDIELALKKVCSKH
jgi:D-psicose/D-tagatose/L-ribulose 3-epimerase